MPATISPLEAIFILALSGGTLLSLGLLADAIGDLRHQRRARRNGLRTIAAWGNVRRECERLAIYAAWLVVGLVFAARPPTNPDRPLTPTGLALTAVILFAVATLVAGSALDRRERRRLLAAAARGARAGGIPDEDRREVAR